MSGATYDPPHFVMILLIFSFFFANAVRISEALRSLNQAAQSWEERAWVTVELDDLKVYRRASYAFYAPSGALAL
jgi:hypothetical protein